MRPEVQSKLEPFFRTVSSAPGSALLLDYDGTLAPFREQRDRAFPYPGVAPLLQEIIRNGRTRVVVITGRDVIDLLPLLDIRPRPEVWGVHGMQRLALDGAIRAPHLDERTLDALSDADRWLRYQELRHTGEIKPGSIAVHWRGLSDVAAEDLRSRVMLGWRLIAAQGGLDLLEFDGGLEIRASQANKGEAVRDLLSELSADMPAAYLGDDATDEAAFHAIDSRGLAVLVRPQRRQSLAHCWLKPPDELLEFLGLWLRSCAQVEIEKGNAAKAVNG